MFVNRRIREAGMKFRMNVFYIAFGLWIGSVQGAEDWNAYITDMNIPTNSVQVLDVTTNTVGPTIPIDPNITNFLNGIAITPDRQTAYVNSVSDVLAINTNINMITATVPIPAGAEGYGVAISPDGTKAYAVVAFNADVVNVIDVATNTITATITLPLGSEAFGVAITPDGTKGYVTCRVGSGSIGNVVVFNTATNTVIGSPITVGATPQGIAITPDGTLVYVANRRSGDVSVISTATNTVIATIPLETSGPASLFGIAITPNGSKAYITTGPNTGPLGHVDIVDIPSNTVDPASPIPIGHFPQGIAITPDGLTAYALNGNDRTTSVINTTTNKVTNTISLNIVRPFEIAITPDQAPIASFTAAPQGNSITFNFDGSGSHISPESPSNLTIVKYVWDFGDGNTATTTTPTVSHTYASAGNFTVSLTVTNSAGTSTTQVFTGRTVYNNGGPSAMTSQVISIPTFVSPPTNADGFQVKNKFLNATEYVNILKWAPPTSGRNPISYRIYRDAALTKLIGVILANEKLKFEVVSRKKDAASTYFIVSVDAFNIQSAPVEVFIPAAR